jgi:YD repeat-containing protein
VDQRLQSALTFPALVKGGDVSPEWAPDGRTLTFAQGDAVIAVDPDTGHTRVVPAGEGERHHVAEPRVLRPGFLANTPPVRELPSPDGRWFATEQADDLWLRDAASDRLVPVTQDGRPDYRWDIERAGWSPDSTVLMVTRVDTRGVERIPVVHWLENTERVEWFPYTRTGGRYPRTELYAVALDERTPVRVKLPIEELFWISLAGWSSSGEPYVMTADRFDKTLSLFSVDTRTGAARKVVEEHQDTFVHGIRLDHIRNNVFQLPGSELVWFSERDGWRHAYRYDANGELINRVTIGEFEVERVVGLDQETADLFVLAHSDPGRPYDIHLCAVGLDGSGFRQVSTDPGIHRAHLAPGGGLLVDNHSSLHRPPQSDLLRVDGSKVATISTADLAAVRDLDLGTVEEFTATAPDGRTILHGTLWKPPGMDRTARYPVVELIYAGPQSVLHAREFRQAEAILALALAQFGLVVFCVDGRGTPERGKAFQDVVYGRFGQHEIAEHSAVLDQLLEAHPYMDGTRVGIVGGSWGGYMALRALVTAPQTYHVGVCIYGVGDLVDHMAQAIEPYMGDSNENAHGYEQASSLGLLHRLRGKLLLVHGTSDVNATFSATMKIVDRLIEEDKPFDLLVVPEMAHAMIGKGREYAVARVVDYLATNLGGVVA